MDITLMNKSEFRRWLAGEMEEVIKDAVKRAVSKLKTHDSFDNKRFFTVKTLCKELDVCRTTIKNYVDQGKLIKYKIKGRVYFKTEEVEKLINYSKK